MFILTERKLKEIHSRARRLSPQALGYAIARLFPLIVPKFDDIDETAAVKDEYIAIALERGVY